MNYAASACDDCTVPLSLPRNLAVYGGGAFAWYAMPDFVRPPCLRGLLKFGLLTMWGYRTAEIGMHAAMAKLNEPPNVAAEGDTLPDTDLGDLSLRVRPGLAVGVLAALAGSTALSVVAEKWIYRRGERRRAQGTPLAHTRQALPLALLTAAVVVPISILTDTESHMPM